MKITLNNDDLRMTVLKQIVSNASTGMSIERKLGFIDWIFPYTSKNMRLKSLRIRGDKLWLFEKALAKNKNENVEIEFTDVNFIYEGLY